MSLVKHVQMHSLRILSDVRFAELLWCAVNMGINMINIHHLWLTFRQASAPANAHSNQDWLFSRDGCYNVVRLYC